MKNNYPVNEEAEELEENLIEMAEMRRKLQRAIRRSYIIGQIFVFVCVMFLGFALGRWVG